MKRASAIPKFGKEVVLQAAKLSNPEARFLVSNYYMAQEMRKRCDMQLRHIGEKDFPEVLNRTSDSFAIIESEVQKSLKAYAESSLIGRWIMSHYMIGPVIAAGCIAHLDIEKAPSAGHFWTFAGLNPEKRRWGKGEKRPFNADMRQIMFHMGECAKRGSGVEHCFYGQIYKARKAFLVKRNEEGYNRERAKTYTTTSANVRKVLADGKLPPGNIDSQAMNYAAKIFLSHLHAVMFYDWFGAVPEKPYAITILGHVDLIRVPNGDMFPGFEEAYYRPRTV